MRITLPIKVEIRGKAHSIFDDDTIERRLAVLRERNDEQAKEEIAFLEDLKRQRAK